MTMVALAPDRESHAQTGELEFVPANAFGLTADDKIGFFVAHPDDGEVMLGHAIQEATGEFPGNTHAMVAVHGRESTRGNPELVKNNHRVIETVNGLGMVGVRTSRMFMPNLPDGELSEPKNYRDLVDRTTKFLARRALTHAVTLGRDGGDGNPDHIATHMAVVQAVKDLGSDTQILGLNSRGNGEVIILSDEERLARKMAAIAANATQFPMYRHLGDTLPSGQPVPGLWRLIGGYAVPPETVPHLEIYEPYLSFETFDRY